MSEIENFIVVEHTLIQNFISTEYYVDMLCIKCEKAISFDLLKSDEFIWCETKKVFVPHCTSCGNSDIEE
jgi:hypothetical protein